MKSKVNNIAKKDKGSKKGLGKKLVIPIVVASILVVILIFGIVFGAIAIMRERRAVVSYGSVNISEGVAAYLASTYKTKYIDSIPPEVIFIDNEKFWITEMPDSDITWGEDLERATEEYIRAVAVRAYLFDRNRTLSKDDREAINKSISEVLDHRAGGSVAKFNEMSQEMGFTYDDFCDAAELLYKDREAINVIYGYNGASLAYADSFSLAKEYLQTAYSHVKVICIRKADRFEYDGANILYDGEGNAMMSELAPDEIARREAVVEEISQKIENLELGLDNQMSPEAFDAYYEQFKLDDPTKPTDGYYLNAKSGYTISFNKYYPELTLAALSMEKGEYRRVDTEDVTYFVYRYDIEDVAYVEAENETYFGDFYSLAAQYHFDIQVGELLSSVLVKDSFYDIEIRYLKRNTSLVINE